MQKYLVIGAGRFGKGIVKELSKHNKAEVVVCDEKEEYLEELKDVADFCVVGDCKKDEILDELVIERFDKVFVAIGTNEHSAMLIVKKLKDRKAKRIIAKTVSKEMSEILQLLGADYVVSPEEEAGMKVAQKEMYEGMIEYLVINNDMVAIEMKVPKRMFGKNLIQLNFSKKYDLTVVSMKRNGQLLLKRFAEIPFQEEDIMIIVGEKESINNFKRKYLLQ